MTGVRWCEGTGRNCLAWSSTEGAVVYRVYRGEDGSAHCLLTTAVDSCLRAMTDSASTGPGVIPENPGSGRFLWFLVTAENADGEEGPPGNATAGARTRDGSTTCAGSCVASGGSCSVGGDCCSGNCAGGTCAASCCASSAQHCFTPDDCCNAGYCQAGGCSVAPQLVCHECRLLQPQRRLRERAVLPAGRGGQPGLLWLLQQLLHGLVRGELQSAGWRLQRRLFLLPRKLLRRLLRPGTGRTLHLGPRMLSWRLYERQVRVRTEGTNVFGRRRLACSFCKRGEAEVAKLVAGPHVYICDRCVALASQIMERQSGAEPPGPEPRHGLLQLLIGRIVRVWQRRGSRPSQRRAAAH